MKLASHLGIFRSVRLSENGVALDFVKSRYAMSLDLSAQGSFYRLPNQPEHAHALDYAVGQTAHEFSVAGEVLGAPRPYREWYF